MAAAPQPILFNLVEGGSADLGEVMAVMTAAFSPEFGEGWSRSQCAGILPLAGVRLILARTDLGETVGFSLERSVAGEAELLLLAVAPRYRGNGVGSALLQRFIDFHRTDSVERLHLEVRSGNPAVAMYEKSGFRAAGRRINYYRGSNGMQHDAVTMVRDL